MIEHHQDEKNALADVGHADARHDETQSHIVERGISMQQSSNTMSAVEFMKSRDIGPQVIARVLLEPERRRSSDE